MLPALLLVLAAAPEKGPPRVLIRPFLDSVKESERDIIDTLAAELSGGQPAYEPLFLTPEAKAQLDTLRLAIEEECKARIPDMNVTACQFNMLDAAQGRVFSKLGADHVVDVFAEQLVEKPNIIMNIAVWDPQTGRGRRLSRTVAIEEFETTAHQALAQLLNGGGESYQRPVRTLDELRKGWKPFKKEYARRGLPVVLHSRGCLRPLPPKLNIAPDDGLARTLADRWQTSVAGHALGKQPETCTLQYQPLSDAEVLVHVMLTCGAVKSTSLMRGSSALDAIFARLSEDLVADQLELRCTGAFGDTPHAALHLEELIGSLASSRDYESAMDDLVQFGPKAVPALVAGLSNPNALVRQRVATTLGYLGAAARDAVPALERAAKDADPSVAAAAKQALQDIRG